MTLTVNHASDLEFSLPSFCMPWRGKLLHPPDARSKQGALVFWDMSQSNSSYTPTPALFRAFRFLASLFASLNLACVECDGSAYM